MTASSGDSLTFGTPKIASVGVVIAAIVPLDWSLMKMNAIVFCRETFIYFWVEIIHEINRLESNGGNKFPPSVH